MKCKTCNGLGRTKATEFVGVDEGLREVVILCPACGGTGKVVHPMMSMNGDEYTGEWEQHECEACNGTGVVEPLTNEEWLKQCTTEQLAEFLADKCNEVVETVLSDASCDIGDIDNDDYWYRQADFVEWLKEKHDA